MNRRRLAQDLTAILLVCCAVTVTGLSVKRELFPPVEVREPLEMRPVPVENGARIAAAGHPLGPPEPDLEFVVFSDFECPACRTFALEVIPFIREYTGAKIGVRFRHWPLSRHRLAYPAARAAECAGDQGRFEAYHNLLFSHQDSIGLKPFSAFASESGVPDIEEFERCNSQPGPVPRIEADAKEAQRIGARGTPSIILENLLLQSPLDSARFMGLLEKALREG